jgi:hypothetical protein
MTRQVQAATGYPVIRQIVEDTLRFARLRNTLEGILKHTRDAIKVVRLAYTSSVITSQQHAELLELIWAAEKELIDGEGNQG